MTTIAAGYDLKYLVWIGAALNTFASLMSIFESSNAVASKRLWKDIEAIRDGTYIDESENVDLLKTQSQVLEVPQATMGSPR